MKAIVQIEMEVDYLDPFDLNTCCRTDNMRLLPGQSEDYDLFFACKDCLTIWMKIKETGRFVAFRRKKA